MKNLYPTIGYNYATDSIPFDKAVDAMKRSHSDFHVVMCSPPNGIPRQGDIDDLWKVYNALENPQLTLMWRWYNELEGQWKEYPKPSVYAAALKGKSLPPNTIIDSKANEPQLNGSDVIQNRAYINQEIDMLTAIHTAGHRYAVGAFSVGMPHESLLLDVYSSLWVIVDAAHAAISAHCYNQLPLEAGEMVPYEAILHPEEWQNFFDIKWTAENVGMWLLARPYRLFDIFEFLGLRAPEIYLSESLVDQIANVPDWIKAEFKKKFGIDRYQNDPRGIMTWETWLGKAFPNNTLSQACDLVVDHARRNILYPYAGIALFGLNRQWGYNYWGGTPGAHKEAGSNWEEPALDDFRNIYLPAINLQVKKEKQMAGIVMKPGTVTVRSETSNIRMQPNTAAEVVKVISGTNRFLISAETIKDDQGVEIRAAGYPWYFVQSEVGDASLMGFIAYTMRILIDYDSVVEPPLEDLYELSINGATKIINKAELDIHIDLAELWLATLKTLQPSRR